MLGEGSPCPTQNDMHHIFGADYVSLHVRVSNQAPVPWPVHTDASFHSRLIFIFCDKLPAVVMAPLEIYKTV